MAAIGAFEATSLLFAYPFDLVRIRMALDIGKTKDTREYYSNGNCFKSIYKTDGFRGLYKGYGLNVLLMSLYRGIYLGLYDTCGIPHLAS
jgi:solute carrier family 25 (adenine nucleotide translocator) protein 4/5/6/31